MGWVLALAAAVAAGDPDPRPDKLNGRWVVTALVEDGRALEAGPEVDVSNGGFRLDWLGTNYTGTFRTDASKKIPEVDLAQTDADGVGIDAAFGIYELKGDRLRVCWRKPEGGGRPAAFESKPGSKTTLVTLERKKN